MALEHFATVGTIIAGAVCIGLLMGPEIGDRDVAAAATTALNTVAHSSSMRSVEFYKRTNLFGVPWQELRCRGDLSSVADRDVSFDEQVYALTPAFNQAGLALSAARKGNGDWVVLSTSTKKRDISVDGINNAVRYCVDAVSQSIADYAANKKSTDDRIAANLASYKQATK